MWAGWGPEAQEAQLSTDQGMIQALAQVCASSKSLPFPQHLHSLRSLALLRPTSPDKNLLTD